MASSSTTLTSIERIHDKIVYAYSYCVGLCYLSLTVLEWHIYDNTAIK
jgi:hypothetical protein